MKKTALRLSSLGFLALAVATTALAAGKPVALGAKPGFAVSLTGLYLQPTASNLEYAVETEPLPPPAPSWKQESVQTTYSPAFDAGLQYTLGNRVDQFNLSWLHLGSNDSSSAAASGSTSVAPSYYFGPLAQDLRNSSAKGRVKFTVDDVNLSYGHWVSLGEYVQLKPFVGLNTAYLKEYIAATYKGLGTGDVPYSITSYNTSRFMGIGPKFGVNATSMAYHHFSIVAKLAAALLVGAMHSKTTFNSMGQLNPTPVKTGLADQTETRVVPEIDSQLGIKYAIAFASGSLLTLQAGYKIAVYINGINQVVPTALALSGSSFNEGVMAIGSSAQVQSDLGLNGPYLGVSWAF
jgi:hypothetical protein